MKVTERIIGKANLSWQEAMVVRDYYELESEGKKTRGFVENLSPRKREQLLVSAQKKIREVLRAKRVEG